MEDFASKAGKGCGSVLGVLFWLIIIASVFKACTRSDSSTENTKQSTNNTVISSSAKSSNK